MIHIVGIVGMPPRYGGFETLVDYLLDSKRLCSHGVVVYCEKSSSSKLADMYKGSKLIPLVFQANGWQSVIYDSIGLWKSSLSGGIVLILGTSATFWLPLLRLIFPRVCYITNMAGLEWGRAKWGFFAKKLLKLNEAAAAKYSNILIADNRGLIEYVRVTYGCEAVLIPYGGDQFENIAEDFSVFDNYQLPLSYDFAMARAQVDNNMEMILNSYSKTGLPLVFVSNWSFSDYGQSLLDKYGVFSNIYLIGPIYENAMIKALHTRVRLYVHGHSAGGTNPVLVEAMWAGLATVAYDVNFNRHTTNNKALFFKSSEELSAIALGLTDAVASSCGHELQLLAKNLYSWDLVTSAYEKIILGDRNI